jgi:hypothetical protein
LQTFGGGPSGGYIIDYTTRPRAVFRWHRRVPGQEPVITPLPNGVRLLYTDFPLYEPSAHVREFTVEELESIDFEANDIMYAAVFYEDIWEDAPGESPAASPTATPNAPSDVGIRVAPNPATGSPTVTEERRFNTNCPICQEDFTVGQESVQYRCGHVTCISCYDTLIHSGWNRCTICRRGATRTRRVRIAAQPSDDMDLSVFMRHPTVIERDIAQCRAES